MFKSRTTNAVNRMPSNHLDVDINMLLLSEAIQYCEGPVCVIERLHDKTINAMDISKGVIGNLFQEQPVILFFKFLKFLSCPVLMQLRSEHKVH
jgi:hypothetical protein